MIWWLRQRVDYCRITATIQTKKLHYLSLFVIVFWDGRRKRPLNHPPISRSKNQEMCGFDLSRLLSIIVVCLWFCLFVDYLDCLCFRLEPTLIFEGWNSPWAKGSPQIPGPRGSYHEDSYGQSADWEYLSLDFWEAPGGPGTSTPSTLRICCIQTLWGADSQFADCPYYVTPGSS